MLRYLRHLNADQTPQTERADARQAMNAAGGYSFVVSDWTRLERFLILGAEGGTYYATERTLTVENAKVVERCLLEDGVRTVEMIASISESGRAPKQAPAIFALALAAAHPDDAARAAALSALPRVCRTASQLFEFVAAVRTLRGFGRGLRRAIARWYTARDADEVAYQAIKYRQRSGFTHRDVLRLAGGAIGPHGASHEALFRWIVAGTEGFGERVVGSEGAQRTYAAVDASALPARVVAFEALQRETDPRRAAELIDAHRLTHEMVPTPLLASGEVWRALLRQMPLTAMLRNLGRLTSMNVLTQHTGETKRVVKALTDRERLRRARIHPLGVLVALETYRKGQGVRGKLTWKPVPQITAALERAFDLSFGTIPASGKRTLLALDVSGSMGWGAIAGMAGITPRVASAAMAMATMRAEDHWSICGFSHDLVPLDLHPQMSLAEVMSTVSKVPMGGTDCAKPMQWALAQKAEVDAFVVYTDNETWHGQEHPHQALARYRQAMGIDAKLIVVGMTATNFSIAQPDDAGMLDLVGFDTSAPRVMSDFIRG